MIKEEVNEAAAGIHHSDTERPPPPRELGRKARSPPQGLHCLPLSRQGRMAPPNKKRGQQAIRRPRTKKGQEAVTSQGGRQERPLPPKDGGREAAIEPLLLSIEAKNEGRHPWPRMRDSIAAAKYLLQCLREAAPP